MTSLTVTDATDHQHYIPYTNRPLKWHTDGYYNGPRRQIHGLLLHCVHPAAAGGENALLDHEIAYIFLRDENPDFIRVLMEPEVMTIPAREEDGSTARPACTGPVFSVDPVSGALHMRYTARRHHVHWKAEPLVRAAVSFLAQLLTSDLPFIFRGRLEAGMGLLCNNVLHDRAGFDDAPGAPPRLLYRARYYDRIAGT